MATKAAQSALDLTNASVNVAYSNINALGTLINDGYSTLESSIATKASQINVDAALDSLTLAVGGKQDLIGQSLTLGALNISGGADVALLQHSGGVALY